MPLHHMGRDRKQEARIGDWFSRPSPKLIVGSVPDYYILTDGFPEPGRGIYLSFRYKCTGLGEAGKAGISFSADEIIESYPFHGLLHC